MDSAHNPLVGGAFLIAGGLAAFAYAIFLEGLRRAHMRRVQLESGATMSEVESWFRPSHGWLSDGLRRGVALSIGYAMVNTAIAEISGTSTPLPLSLKPAVVAEVVSCGVGLSLLVAPICAALLFLLCAERLAGSNVLLELKNTRYDYAAAARQTRAVGRAGPLFSVTARLFGLLLLGIAWFIASTVSVHLVPQLHDGLGK